MIIKKYSNTFKKCDKCRVSNKKIVIYRVCFMIHFPYYSYFGFDLCENCLKELEALLKVFLSSFNKENRQMKGGVKNGI